MAVSVSFSKPCSASLAMMAGSAFGITGPSQMPLPPRITLSTLDFQMWQVSIEFISWVPLFKLNFNFLITLLPAISQSTTALVSPGSNRTAVPAMMLSLLPVVTSPV